MTIEGHAAKAILEDPTVRATLDLIESALKDQWELATTSEQREEVWYTLQGAKRFRNVLTQAVENMEFDAQLKEKQNG